MEPGSALIHHAVEQDLVFGIVLAIDAESPKLILPCLGIIYEHIKRRLAHRLIKCLKQGSLLLGPIQLPKAGGDKQSSENQ